MSRSVDPTDDPLHLMLALSRALNELAARHEAEIERERRASGADSAAMHGLLARQAEEREAAGAALDRPDAGRTDKP